MNYTLMDDAKGILGFKRYNMARILMALANRRHNINESLMRVQDARRTMTRIMESIKADANLSERLKKTGYFDNYCKLENAVEAVLRNAENPNNNFRLPDEDDIACMAQ